MGIKGEGYKMTTRSSRASLYSASLSSSASSESSRAPRPQRAIPQRFVNG